MAIPTPPQPAPKLAKSDARPSDLSWWLAAGAGCECQMLGLSIADDFVAKSKAERKIAER